jgi:RNA polymerase sigma-70 factor (ECF subfamily)
MKVEEIADITGLTASNVKIKLYRGRQNLLKELRVILKMETNSLL